MTMGLNLEIWINWSEQSIKLIHLTVSLYNIFLTQDPMWKRLQALLYKHRAVFAMNEVYGLDKHYATRDHHRKSPIGVGAL